MTNDFRKSASAAVDTTSTSGPVRAIKIHLLPKSGFALAVLANLIWGTSFLTSKYTLKVWGPFTASALRFAIALAGMLLILPALGLSIELPRSRKVWARVFLVGLSGFGILYPLQLAGLAWIPSSLSAAIMLTSPLFVLLLAAGFQGEMLSPQKLIAIGLGMFGGVMLVSPGNFQADTWTIGAIGHLIKGSLLTLGASASLAVSVIATRSASKELDSRSLTFWSMCVGEALLIPFALFESKPAVTTGSFGYAFIALLFLALFCSVFAFLIWNRAISLTSPQNLASTMHIKTPVAVFLGTIIVGEPVTFSIVSGILLISFAVWLSQWKPRIQIIERAQRVRI